MKHRFWHAVLRLSFLYFAPDVRNKQKTIHVFQSNLSTVHVCQNYTSNLKSTVHVCQYYTRNLKSTVHVCQYYTSNLKSTVHVCQYYTYSTNLVLVYTTLHTFCKWLHPLHKKFAKFLKSPQMPAHQIISEKNTRLFKKTTTDCCKLLQTIAKPLHIYVLTLPVGCSHLQVDAHSWHGENRCNSLWNLVKVYVISNWPIHRYTSTEFVLCYWILPSWSQSLSQSPHAFTSTSSDVLNIGNLKSKPLPQFPLFDLDLNSTESGIIHPSAMPPI